ncbi:MAG: ABC transporter substrate-binding protein [Candidatus Bathyarchaeota archaeon]|nr:ABC transporter substrate-binding protein [Candidatus Termiticorpusculum sp.]
MTKKTIIIIALITLIASISAYAIYEFYAPPSAPKLFSQSSVTVVDGVGNTVTVQLPINRIVVLDGNLAEFLCLMDLQDSIIGRTDAQCPPQLLNVPSVGEAAYALNVETILELQPDLIIADSLLTYDMNGAYKKLKDANMPIYISQATPPPQNPLHMTAEELYNAPTGIDVTCSVMYDLAAVVGNKDRVDTFVTWAQGYNKLVKDRIATLPREQQTLSFIDWYDYPYSTWVYLDVYQAGGINIAENSTTYNPVLSREIVVETNPSVIIEIISSPTHDVKDFIAARNDVLGRPALKNVDAVKNGHVYICDFSSRNGLRSIIGYLYWAKWLQPDLFSDINPEHVSEELYQQFGVSMNGTYCYP